MTEERSTSIETTETTTPTDPPSDQVETVESQESTTVVDADAASPTGDDAKDEPADD